MEPFAASPIRFRPPLRWPGGARVALWVVPNVEHYEYLPAFVRTRDPWPRVPHPDVLGYAMRDYGNRVGIYRLFESMDALGLRGSVSLSLSVLERYPALHEAMAARGWEYFSHGIANTRYHWDLSEDEERGQMLLAQEIHERITGRRLRGWFSPAVSHTRATFDLAAECGYDWTADLYHDDQPFPVRTRSGRDLISLPYSMEINDAVLHARGHEAEAFARMIRDAFETLHAEGAEQGRVLCVAVHPWWVGAPHRIGPFREALAAILAHGGVWPATGAEIADWWRAQHAAPLAAHLAARAAC